MRINRYVAASLGISRREADDLITQGRLIVNGAPARIGQDLSEGDVVEMDGKRLEPKEFAYLVLNKPVGYVCSRQGQGSSTVFELLPQAYANLNTVGRLDKDSSGLVLLTNDGEFAHKLTHPKFAKAKDYELRLNKPLTAADARQIEQGVKLEDGLSRLELLNKGNPSEQLHVRLTQGRNRQIRRTFSALGYEVKSLHRYRFGNYRLEGLQSGRYKEVSKSE